MAFCSLPCFHPCVMILYYGGSVQQHFWNVTGPTLKAKKPNSGMVTITSFSEGHIPTNESSGFTTALQPRTINIRLWFRSLSLDAGDSHVLTDVSNQVYCNRAWSQEWNQKGKKNRFHGAHYKRFRIFLNFITRKMWISISWHLALALTSTQNTRFISCCCTIGPNTHMPVKRLRLLSCGK